MKFVNKFLFVAVISVGLYSCGDSGLKTELAASKSEVDSLHEILDTAKYQLSLLDEVDTTESSLLATYTPLGDGGSDGHHNISIKVDDSGRAKLYVLKNRSGVITVALTIDLSTHTARISTDGTNLNVTPILGYDPYGRSGLFEIGNLFDMKITKVYKPTETSSEVVAIVGAEDPRAGVKNNDGYHHIFTLPSNNTKMRIYQTDVTKTTLDISTNGSCNWSGGRKDYCSGTSSTTGVKFWDEKFQKFCY